MIDNCANFHLKRGPFTRKQLERHASGLARGGGGIAWSFGRKRGLAF